MKFDIERFIAILKNEYPNWDAPVITFMANQGATPFEILVSTLLSLRTKDQVTAVAAAKLFEKARTPQEMLLLTKKQIQKLIYPVGFYLTKANRLHEISQRLLDDFAGQVPNEIDELLKLPGVGRKTANLVLIEGFNKEGLCVDTHVHRISNRIGYVRTTTAEKTEFALREKLPKKHWLKYNEMLVAFGQMICRPISPWCSKCSVNSICRKIEVHQSR